MPTDTSNLVPSSAYATLLTELRIAALRALADILATSDDPKEKRQAATAILRAPEPEEPQVFIRPHQERPPLRPYSDDPPRPAQALHAAQSTKPQPSLPPLPAPNCDSADLEPSPASDLLDRIGVPIETLKNMPATEALKLIRSAGRAPPA